MYIRYAVLHTSSYSRHRSYDVRRILHNAHTLYSIDSTRGFFTQIAGGDYFLFPILRHETHNCEQALKALAVKLWDYLHTIRVEMIQFPNEHNFIVPSSNLVSNSLPSSTTTGSTSLTANINAQRLLKIKRQESHQHTAIDTTSNSQARTYPLQKLLSSTTDPGVTLPSVISSSANIRHCYGKDQDDQLRISMVSLTQDQSDRITKLHQQ